MRWLLLPVATVAAAIGILSIIASRSRRTVRTIRHRLSLSRGAKRFEPGMVRDLPDPARRFLLRAIEPGTPLARSVELEMQGEILLSPGRAPLPMRADQVLAPPDGFVWRADAGRGLLRIDGFDRFSDGSGEMRWSLWGLLPVIRATGPDVTRSAAGRLAIEALVLPSALVPGRGVAWNGIDEERAAFRLRVGEETVETTVRVDEEGRLLEAEAMRWSGRRGGSRASEGADHGGYEPFGARFEGELRSGGYTLPSRIAAGWRPGRPDEFLFFQAELERARFR